MATIVMRSHVGKDGVLKLQVPDSMREKDVEVTLKVNSGRTDEIALDANGWPVGFFDRMYGCLKDVDLERPPELPLEPVDPIE